MSVSLWAYVPDICDGNSCPGDCDKCRKWEDADVETNIYDIEEIHENCTVQVLKNSVTGEISVGWWEND